MHFGDYTFIFLMALVLFGPKKLPEIGRQIGRLMMEFRRASNEFKMQMDEELRNMEEQDRLKRVESSLKEQTERVLAVAPQLEPLPSDPSQIVQALPEQASESSASNPAPHTPLTGEIELSEAKPTLAATPYIAAELNAEVAQSIPEPARWHQGGEIPEPANEPTDDKRLQRTTTLPEEPIKVAEHTLHPASPEILPAEESRLGPQITGTAYTDAYPETGTEKNTDIATDIEANIDADTATDKSAAAESAHSKIEALQTMRAARSTHAAPADEQKVEQAEVEISKNGADLRHV